MSIACGGTAGYAATVERTFGQNMKLLRERRGVTQIEMARRLKVLQGQVSSWERDRRMPGAASVKRIAAALGCEPADLLAGVVTEYDRLRGATAPTAPPQLGELLTPNEEKALQIFRTTAEHGQPKLLDHMQTFQRGFPRPQSPESTQRSGDTRTATKKTKRG